LLFAREAGISGAACAIRRLLEHRSERTFPAFTQGRNPQRAFQLRTGMSRQVQQSVDLCDCDPFRAIRDFYDVVARANFSFLQNAEVESRPVMRDQQRRHAGFVHPQTDTVAGDARLRHLKECAANAVPVANANLAIGKSFDGEVFAELAEGEIIAAKELLPVAIRIHLIEEDSAVFSTVAGQIALSIAIDV
jgi:hypothetical protein